MSILKGDIDNLVLSLVIINENIPEPLPVAVLNSLAEENSHCIHYTEYRKLKFLKQLIIDKQRELKTVTSTSTSGNIDTTPNTAKTTKEDTSGNTSNSEESIPALDTSKSLEDQESESEQSSSSDTEEKNPTFGQSLVTATINFLYNTSKTVVPTRKGRSSAEPTSDNSLENNRITADLSSTVAKNTIPTEVVTNLYRPTEQSSETSEIITASPITEMAKTFIQLGKYNEKSGPIRNFIRDFEDLLIIDNITAGVAKKAALRTLLPYTIRDFLESKTTEEDSYDEIKELLIQTYDGSISRRIANDKIRYFKLKYTEHELESSINQFGKLVKESLDETDVDVIKSRQLSRLKEKLEDNYSLFVHFRTNERHYTTFAEAASDLQITLNDNVRLSKNRRQNQNKQSFNNKDYKKTEITCTGCYNLGHKYSECRSKNIICKKCNKKGHYASKCPNQSSGTSNSNANNMIATDNTPINQSNYANAWDAIRNYTIIFDSQFETKNSTDTNEWENLENFTFNSNFSIDTDTHSNEFENEVLLPVVETNTDNEKYSKRTATISCDMYIKVEFEDQFIAPGIVDTGCQKTCIPLTRAKILGFDVTKGKPGNVYLASGKSMDSHGIICTTLKFDCVLVKVECCVLPDHWFSGFLHHIFVGTDVLKATCSTINFGDNTILMCGRPVSIVVKNRPVVQSLFRVTETINSSTKEIEDIKNEYDDIISKHKYDIGLCKLSCPTLKVTSENPPKIRRYSVPEGKRKLVMETINIWEKNKICQQDDSVTWIMNLVIVPKKDNQDRICLDTRPLNAVLIGDAYTTPTLADIRCKLSNGRYFTTFDMTQSFMQLPLDNISSQLLGFKAPDGRTYKFLRMPYGLKIATSVFQRSIDIILRDLSFATSYVDDILVVTKTNLSDHYMHIRQVLERLRSYQLKINASKSQWCGSSVYYLGYTFSAAGQQPSDVNIAAIVNYPAPKSLKSLRRYLGKIGYFRNNIKNLATLQKPLTDILRNKKITASKTSFIWSEEAEMAFLKTKKALTEATVISYPDFDKEFCLHTDASADTFAASLTQQLSPDKITILGFFSKRNPERKKFIPATYLELRCVAESLDYFRQYLYGHKTILYTDHSSIIKICENNTDRNLFRYVEKIMEYDVEIRYIKGELNVVSDAISRAHLLRISYNHDPKVSIKKETMLQQISKLDCSDLPKTGLKKIPEISEQEKLAAMIAAHDDMGHLSYEKCYPLLIARNKWPGISLDFRKHIQSCSICLARNEPRKPTYKFTHTTADFPFQKMAIDICGPFRTTEKGNKFYIGAVDLLSKYIILSETPTADGPALIKFITDKIIFQHSTPVNIKFDNAQYCKNKFLLQFLDEVGITYTYSTPLHHEGNCHIERVFRSIHTLMAKELQIHPDLQWDDCLVKISYYYNISVHNTTKMTPYFLIHGRNPILKSDITLNPDKLKYIVDYDLEGVINKCNMQFAFKIAKEVTEIHRSKLNDKQSSTSNLPVYNIGDKVLIKRPDLKKEQKLESPWKSGYEITAVFENYVNCKKTSHGLTKLKGRPRKVFITDLKIDKSYL
uniref:RNA-directed DNA polymerase n=1 Tax=Parastrongyloides trichosuri TaxID=131310 RepID=A0A0N4Z5P4_PARTI